MRVYFDKGVNVNVSKKILPGFGVCFVLAIAAYAAGLALPIVGGPVFAIIFGMIFYKKIAGNTNFFPGVAFTSKKMLQGAIVLLGFGLNLSTVAKVGMQSLPIILSTISTSLIIAYVVCKVFHIERRISMLVGIGSSVCGGSAIAATAPVIDATDDEVATAISVIFFYNIIAAVLFPQLGTWLGMSDYGFGLFAGTAINDTSSVTAAAATWDMMYGGNALDTATIVKLTRTLSIIPITLVLGIYTAYHAAASEGVTNGFSLRRALPIFIILFLVAVVLTTFMSLPEVLVTDLKWLSKFMIIMAMGAIGLNTNVSQLIKRGGKPLLMGLACWIGITLVSLLVQGLLGIW